MPHVFQCPNTSLGEGRFRGLLADRVRDGRVLDLGCGAGTLTAQLHVMGARSVHGIDTSIDHINEAHSNLGHLPGVSFALQAAEQPMVGEFDLIVGRSILHRIDFQHTLTQLYERNLAPDGRMVFMEPTSHPLMLAFQRLARQTRTSDQRRLTANDATWLHGCFGARIVPINLASLPAGLVSSLLLDSPDNKLTRLADAIDHRLERNRHCHARGRQAIIVIDRPTWTLTSLWGPIL